ncbi:hypothetical protein BB413_06900 [Helicobacter pylori]|uniref:Uncharacterized protein n=1 Tax=Helicobacter pylori TaxID=210 RepID=A0A2A6XFI2_HELPX|nr:hypothetical protein BB413_06900 [Helicobacter pylori]
MLYLVVFNQWLMVRIYFLMMCFLFFNDVFLFYDDDAFYLKALRLILKLYSLPPSKSFPIISNNFQQFPIISNNFQSFPITFIHSFQTLKFLPNSQFSFKL